MASADATDGAAVAALESRTVTPIAQLDPELPDQNSRSVRGEVTITWPYNRVTHTLAFLLAEPDVRLRRTKGQVRVQLHGPSAKTVADCGLGACDEVLLGLDGVEWTKDESAGRIPGARVDWQLQFNKKLVLQVKLNGSDEPKHINVDSTQIELPNELPEPSAIQQLEQTVDEPEPAVIDNLSAIRKVPDIALNEYPSPAFIKRARISYGSLFEDGLDIFEEDGGIMGKGRKRSRFARKSNGWRYSSKSPSPEPELAPEEDQVSQPQSPDHDAMEEDTVTEAPAPKPKMTDGASQTVESEMTPIPSAASEQALTENVEAVPRPATWEKVDIGNQGTSKDIALQETEVAQAASHILGMANGTISQSYPYQHTDIQAHPAANSLFGSSKPAVSGLSMFGTPASVPVESDYGIADQVRFGCSHTPQAPQSRLPEPQMHAAPETGPYPDSYLDHSIPAKYEGMESYMNIAQSNPELQHGQDYNLVPVPTDTESFERGQWEMATQAPHYNPIEGGHFGADALNEGTPAIIEDPSLHADPTRPDQVPKGFSSYGTGTEGTLEFEEPGSRAESEQDAERSEIEELVENEEISDADEDDTGVDNEVQYDEFGEELEDGDYDQREYNKPESDDEGISQDEEEVELEVAERYGEGDVYDEDEDEEMDDYAEDWERECAQYDDEDAYDSEDNDLGQRPPGRAPAAAAPADPVVISLLSDSEDEDEAPPPPQPTPPTNRRTMTRQLSIRHSSPLKPATTSTEGTSLQQTEKSPPAEKDQPAAKEEDAVEKLVTKEEPTENQSKPWVGHLDKPSSADQKDDDLQPKDDAKPLASAMEIVHTEPTTDTGTEVALTSSLADVKENTSEVGSPAQSTQPPQTLDTESEAQVNKHESDSKSSEEALPTVECDQLDEQEEDKSESEANDETFQGFSSDAGIIERPEEESDSAEDDEMLDEDEDREQDSSQQVVDLLDTTSEEEDEEDEEEQEDDDDTFDPIESESEEDVLEEIDGEDKDVMDEEAFEVVEKDDKEEVVLEVEDEEKIEVKQEVEEKAEEKDDGDKKAVAAETTDIVLEVKETDKGVSEVKDAESAVQEAKPEKGTVVKTAETVDEPKEDETQAEPGETQGTAKSPIALEQTVQKTLTVEEEERLETNNVDFAREAEPKVSLTVTAPADEEQKTSDCVEDVDEMEAIQHQLFDDMVRASREASMMEVSDAEHVSFMSQDTPRPIQVDSDEEMGDGDDEDVEMADAATPRPESHTNEGLVSQAVEVEMTSATIEVDSDSMLVTHEASIKLEITEASHGQDSAMEDADMVVEVEETKVTVEQEVTVTEAPAAQQPQATPSAAVEVIDHAPQQAALSSSPPMSQPFASQVAEDEVMLVGSSSPAKEAVHEKPLSTPNQSGVLDQEVTESSQPEDAQVAAGTVVEESTEVVTQVEIVGETETATTEPQVATTEEGVETQDEVSLIVVEEVSEEQTQDLNEDQADEADESKQTNLTTEKAPSTTEEEATIQREEPSQTTVTPDQSQSGDDKNTGLNVKLVKPAVTASAKRGRKQQPAPEPLRTSARLTRARSGSIPKSATTEENDDVASKAAALASPSKRSFASSFISASAAASEDIATSHPDTTPNGAPLSNDPAVLKLDLSRRLRSEPQFANCLTLKSIRNHLGQNVDILAIVSSTPTNPTRAKGGPREYMMSFNITDPSTAPNHVVEVQMYKAHKEQLPIVKPGDSVLLKQVEIRSMTAAAGKGGFGLRTGENSAWAVFEAIAEEEEQDDDERKEGREGKNVDAATMRPPQIKGPAVENWEEFAGYMIMLKKWYKLLLRDEAAKGKLEKAVKRFEK
ncbi:hypothetical protein QBC32DRAFT_405617 [Pseudoneurospora amorphoporcata]|uniref:Telomeric single stranded DNA binding POT1/Cdc13 domain-containing protein n=1 Tax=Pseudoneurospora amorphoporcata TaxID=241081 RepID=A0AAN6NV59_9PEZI|nr:hypothetical protein QBC32DRAFT_405617 [Pseudoneurospora amorphoporcata]